jgi:hypothetical protein
VTHEYIMITKNNCLEQSLLIMMQRYKENFTFVHVHRVRGNLGKGIEVLCILLIETENEV